jgi:hypothetical protein
MIKYEGLSPIVLFVYKRPEHTRRCLDALAANPEARGSDLIIYSDGPKNAEQQTNVAATREIVLNTKGFRSRKLIARDRNIGLSRNIVDGVTSVMNEFGRAIILEDDLEVSPFFLRYMNEGLALYADEGRVASIHGYSYPCLDPLPATFFLRGADCWGWASWDRSWRVYDDDTFSLIKRVAHCPWRHEFDFDGAYPYRRLLRYAAAGRVDAWDVRWYTSAFLEGMYTLYPGRSLVRNTGHDGSGTHGGASGNYDVVLASAAPRLERLEPATDRSGYEAFRRYFRSLKPPLVRRIARRLRRFSPHSGRT